MRKSITVWEQCSDAKTGQPYELAPAYVYLASSDSSYVTANDTCKWGRYCKWIVFIYKSKVKLIPLIIVSARGYR